MRELVHHLLKQNTSRKRPEVGTQVTAAPRDSDDAGQRSVSRACSAAGNAQRLLGEIEEFLYPRATENAERYRHRLIRQLERLGHKVTLEPLPEAA